MSHILAFDQGTTNSRAVIIDQTGKIFAEVEQECRQSYPKPGWIEQDPNEIWGSQRQTAQNVLKKSGVSLSKIAGIGITNQRETTILWDKESGKPIYPAIVWQDRRTANYCGILRSDGLEHLFKEKTGLLLDPYFSATKILWILENIPGARERAQAGKIAFGTIDTWLVWKLTKGKLHITDVTNASRTLLYNIHDHCWDQELLEMLDIPPSILPTIQANSEVYGHCDSEIFSRPIPIASMIGDQQGALFGQACFSKGETKCTYGTGGFILMNTGQHIIDSRHHLLSTVAYRLKDQTSYALEGSIFIAGGLMSWFRDQLGIIDSPDEIEKLASAVDSSEGVFFIPALTGLGAPHWKPYARGMVLGLSRGSGKNHIARAGLEGIAHLICDVIEAMENDSGIAVQKLKVDGGAAKNHLLLQMQSNFLQKKLYRPQGKEFSALGAAFLAGLATGVWDDLRQIASFWSLEHEFSPEQRVEDAANHRIEWHRALNLAKEWTSE